MKLLILGATGPTGRQLLTHALDAGHEVAVLVRDPSKLDDRRRVELIHGDATNAETMASAVRGRDAVLSALGTGKSPRGGIASRAAANLIRSDVKRLIFISSFGVAESFNDATLLQKFFFRTVLRSIYADKAKADALIQQSPIEWTIVRPVGLTNGPRTGNYRVAEHFELRGFPTVSRADVADFMLRELSDRAWIRKTVVITS